MTFMEPLEPEEIAVWKVLSDTETDDRLTVTEIAAIASALCGRRVHEYVVRETVGPMLRHGHAVRARVFLRGRRRSGMWAYRLTAAGRVRAARVTAGQ